MIFTLDFMLVNAIINFNHLIYIKHIYDNTLMRRVLCVGLQREIHLVEVSYSEA